MTNNQHTLDALLPEICQLLDTYREDFMQRGLWTEWDQSVRDRITAYNLKKSAAMKSDAIAICEAVKEERSDPVARAAIQLCIDELRAAGGVVEAVARQWDGCMAQMFDPAGNPTEAIDVGATIRTDGRPLALVAEELRKMVTDQGTVKAVALDIARWFINGDRPDEFKLKEWAERLDRDAIARAYEDRALPSSSSSQ